MIIFLQKKQRDLGPSLNFSNCSLSSLKESIQSENFMLCHTPTPHACEKMNVLQKISKVGVNNIEILGFCSMSAGIFFPFPSLPCLFFFFFIK